MTRRDDADQPGGMNRHGTLRCPALGTGGRFGRTFTAPGAIGYCCGRPCA
ncbi:MULTISPECIES: hypothetical protein [Inquilinus]|uniref:Uncharacterized protein n=1 Tax=Inquilinus ginsengisoli TaxID=363840 RepID=A0ABU1JQX6_9PROT|nr:hypothetical protein [Inquilinus ginsengisoli]MDR6291017.1 hypothetical protein [Inquilinus ginsengisoli]